MEFQGVYRDLWEVMGRPWRNLAAEAAWGIEHVLGPEHGTLAEGFTLSEQQITAIVPLLARMRLFQALRLQGGEYGDLLMTGAKFGGMLRRAQKVRELLQRKGRGQVSFGRIVGLWGQRPRSDKNDGTVEQIYAALTDKVRTHPWVISQMTLMERPDALQEWCGAYATEFELGILALIAAFDGDISVEGFERNTDKATLPDIPVREYLSCTLRLADGTTVLALNAPAVVRKKGPARPTSTSSTLHWLGHYSPRPDGTVVSMPVRVHARRVTHDLQVQINAQFPGVEVFGIVEEVVDPMEFFNQALGEAMIMLRKAYDELLSVLAGDDVRVVL